MMILYGLKTCDTCRKALKSLPDVEFVDLRGAGVPPEILRAALDQFGAALVNTRSTTWRGLSETDRARDSLELLTDHPALMKRPLISNGGELSLGWSPQTRSTLGVA
mgnify:CR=1 FL=1